jgi:hypothetical protein
MKTNLSTLLLFFEIIIVVVLMAIIVTLNHANGEMNRELSRPHFGTLSTDQRNALILDLEGRNPATLESWADYFRHTLELETLLPAGHGEVEDLFAVYKQHEQPGRSNYFCDLLIMLGHSQRGIGMPKKTLLGYLGEPEKSQEEHGVEKLFYHYTSFGGRSALGVVNLTNGSVSEILVGLKPLPR